MRTFLPPLAIFAAAFAATIPAHAAERQFDWDLYHTRPHACLEKDRIEAACSRGWCDALALRRAIRACAAFGTLGEREPPQ